MSASAQMNPRARAWRTEPIVGSPREFHRTLPGYAPTPLPSAPGIAAALGIGAVFIKDESQRLGLPAFKILGASYAIACALSARFGQTETLGLPELREQLRGAAGPELIAATDGNHGRAVAHVAGLLGIAATIFVPPGVSREARQAIVAEGAELVELELDYDAVVVHAAAQAGLDALLIQDTAWTGYERIPQWIVDGYATLLEEVDEQLADLGRDGVDLVIAPAGVGSFAQAVVHHYRSTPSTPALLCVEPTAAPSVTTALGAGRVVPVPTGETVMTGLNCGTVSALAWPTLRDGLDAAVTVTDEEALAAVSELTSAGVDSGPCGAATLAGLRAAAADPELAHLLGLGPEATVVLLSTEGTAANPQSHAPGVAS